MASRRKGFAVVALVNDAARALKKHGGSHAASLEIVLMHGDLVRRELRLAPMQTPLPCAIFRLMRALDDGASVGRRPSPTSSL